MSEEDRSMNDEMTNAGVVCVADDHEASERVEARQAAKARRREMRRKAEGYEALLIQRDALASRGLRLCERGLDLVEAVEKLFEAMNEGAEGHIRHDLRNRVGDALDDLVELIEFSRTGGDE